MNWQPLPSQSALQTVFAPLLPLMGVTFVGFLVIGLALPVNLAEVFRLAEVWVLI